jgi:hypothetical protein
MPDPIFGEPIPEEPLTQEELDIKEMSEKRVLTLAESLVVEIEKDISFAVPAGKTVEVMQSVRNPGSVIVHLDPTLARLYGSGKCWTEAKIYKKFGKQYHATLKAWDEMVNVFAITELPEDEQPVK